jgi:hypothetical protein
LGIVLFFYSTFKRNLRYRRTMVWHFHIR